MPYEKELGLYPTLEEMQAFVVNKNKRPVIKSTWLKYNVSFFYRGGGELKFNLSFFLNLERANTR